MTPRYCSALILCYGLLSLYVSVAQAAAFHHARVAVYFSPNGGASGAGGAKAAPREVQQ